MCIVLAIDSEVCDTSYGKHAAQLRRIFLVFSEQTGMLQLAIDSSATSTS